MLHVQKSDKPGTVWSRFSQKWDLNWDDTQNIIKIKQNIHATVVYYGETLQVNRRK